MTDLEKYVASALVEAQVNKQKTEEGNPQHLYWQGKADALRVVQAFLRDEDTAIKFALEHQHTEKGLAHIIAEHKRVNSR